jgi:hypothetical protein
MVLPIFIDINFRGLMEIRVITKLPNSENEKFFDFSF